MKKRILFIITQSEFGGAQRFLSTLVAKLDPARYDILVATGTTGDAHFTEHLRNIGIRNTIIPSLVRNPHPIKDFRAVSEIRNLINDFKPTTLFLLSSKAGFLGAKAAKDIAGLNVVYRIGGWAFNDPQSFIRRELIIHMERSSAPQKDYIVLNNTHDYDQAQRLGIRPRKQLVMIHNGIDIAKLKFLSREKAREKLGITAKIIVGTIANFYPSKGLEYFVAAAEQVADNSDIAFVIIGGGAHLPPFSSKVLRAGRIAEAARLLPAFDIFVLPSVKEGFPWVVAEAMAACIPVIATRVGATPEIIQDGQNGFLVEARHPDQIADRIKTLVNNEVLREQFGRLGLATIAEHFSIEKMVHDVEKLL